MFEIILLLLILAGFVYGIIYLRRDDVDKEGNKQDDIDIIFITSIVLLCSAFVFGIIFSERFIQFLTASSKLASIGLMLSKIKSYFVGTSETKSLDNIENMSGGGKIEAIHNDMYDDDLPESDDEEDY
jgi:hypothetical protein